ncbi:hypothetical protein ACFPRL_03465 [Pseudoclavibacter helvolus]
MGPDAHPGPHSDAATRTAPTQVARPRLRAHSCARSRDRRRDPGERRQRDQQQLRPRGPALAGRLRGRRPARHPRGARVPC